ncbi:MAG TPA: polysaccharide biosynthesis/export family protein [Candidatus Dormibacteraeota bacterium]|nr:polysaccharide biosynthesis/export family protein [Candidatus Dormibacteraeota bacterium]
MLAALKRSFYPRLLLSLWAIARLAGGLCLAGTCLGSSIAGDFTQNTKGAAAVRRDAADHPINSSPNLQTSQEWNRRLKELTDTNSTTPAPGPQDYRIGFDDVLDISVFEAQELNREVRVSSAGEISLPLLDSVHVAGLTPRELELVLQELLRRTYMKDPHVSVFVREMQSHPVSVLGAVRRPGVFQVRGSKTLLEILSLAEGLADDAGETVIIMRGAGLQNGASSNTDKASPTEENTEAEDGTVQKAPNKDLSSEGIVQVNLKYLLDSSDFRQNPIVNPGDIVKVLRAGIVYVVGEVQRPGGFTMKSNEKMSVLQVIALSGGLTRTASKAGVRIIRTDEQSGERAQTQIDLSKILAGKAPDPVLEPRDIVFVSNSATKTTFSRGVEAAAQTLTGLLIFHW